MREDLCGEERASSLTVGIYFRTLLTGHFEGSERSAGCLAARGLAWRCSALWPCVRRVHAGSLDDLAHAALPIDLDTIGEGVGWVLGVLADHGLLKGQRITMMRRPSRPDAAMHLDCAARHGRGLRGSSGAGEGLGDSTPTREDLARSSVSAEERTSDKGGRAPRTATRGYEGEGWRTHLAHKAEHAVDLDTGAVLSVTLQAPIGATPPRWIDAVRGRDGGGGAGRARGRVRPHEAPKVNVAGSKRRSPTRVITAARW